SACEGSGTALSVPVKLPLAPKSPNAYEYDAVRLAQSKLKLPEPSIACTLPDGLPPVTLMSPSSGSPEKLLKLVLKWVMSAMPGWIIQVPSPLVGVSKLSRPERSEERRVG